METVSKKLTAQALDKQPFIPQLQMPPYPLLEYKLKSQEQCPWESVGNSSSTSVPATHMGYGHGVLAAGFSLTNPWQHGHLRHKPGSRRLLCHSASKKSKYIFKTKKEANTYQKLFLARIYSVKLHLILKHHKKKSCHSRIPYLAKCVLQNWTRLKN